MAGECGVVLVHGKWGKPPYEHAPLAARLLAEGHRIREPSMPWSLARRYDLPFEQALEEIDGSVRELRQAGCGRVIVCGHSLGAGAALGLAARRRSMDALALLAPGHFPECLAAQALTSNSLSLARDAVAAADERRLALLDCNQGLCRRLRVRPTSYLSYFEPQGPAQWPANARAIAAPLPILMLVGRRDPAYSLGIDYAFAHTPHHPRSEYIEIDADHADTPALGADIVLAWIASLEPDTRP